METGRLALLLSLLLAFVLLVSACPGEDSDDGSFDLADGPFRLGLRVMDGDTGQPAEGIKVFLLIDNRQLEKGLTDADGRYAFGYQKPYTYTVAAGLKKLGYVHAAERVELTKDTEITLTLRKHEGLKIRVEMPPNEPLPPFVSVIYRKEGRKKGPMTKVPIEESGAGHTWAIYPAVYEMTFMVSGYKPIDRQVELVHQGNEPVVLQFEPL